MSDEYDTWINTYSTYTKCRICAQPVIVTTGDTHLICQTDITIGETCTCRNPEAGTHTEYHKWFVTNVLPANPNTPPPHQCRMHP
jgi:hypothetical protein